MILGIDPGMTGAVALVTHQGQFVDAFDMPSGDGRVSIPELVYSIGCWRSLGHLIDYAVVEDVSSMPKQGVSTTFKFGRAAGVAEAVPAALGIPTMLITPAVWKRHLRLSGKGKDASRLEAIRRWPDHLDPHFVTKARGQARADAALLAIAWIERQL